MKRNVWYLVTGILNIVGAISGFFTALIMILMGSGMFTMLAEIDPSIMTPEDIEVMQMMDGVLVAFYYVMIAILLAQIVVSIFASIKFIKFSATNEKSSSTILWIVLTFIFSGVLAGILGIVGYVNNDESSVATVTSTNSQQQNSETIQVQPQQQSSFEYSNLNQLKDLQKLREQNVISEQEYEEMRVRILEQSNKDNNNF